jgi:hypothetical protein
VTGVQTCALPILAPEVWEIERDFFNKPPYQGTLGKYAFLSKVLVLEPPDKSKGSFQTVKELQQLRNSAVHPQTERGTKKVKYSEGNFPPLNRSWLSTKVSAEKRDNSEKNIRQLINELHQAAMVHYPGIVDIKDPLFGILGFYITDE